MRHVNDKFPIAKHLCSKSLFLFGHFLEVYCFFSASQKQITNIKTNQAMAKKTRITFMKCGGFSWVPFHFFFFSTSFVAVRFVCFGSVCICDVFWTLGCAELCFDTLDLAGSCPNGYKAFQGPTGYSDVGKPSNCCSSHVFSVAPL